jgi:hypothetical protein
MTYLDNTTKWQEGYTTDQHFKHVSVRDVAVRVVAWAAYIQGRILQIANSQAFSRDISSEQCTSARARKCNPSRTMSLRSGVPLVGGGG